MIWVDWLILGVIAISAVLATMRGAVREVISLAAWICGAYTAFVYAPSWQSWLEPYIETPEFRFALMFMIILIVILVLGAFIGMFFARLMAGSILVNLDRTLGAVFGVARGLLLVVIFIMLASFTVLPENDWYASSWFLQHLQGMADAGLQWVLEAGILPENSLDFEWELDTGPEAAPDVNADTETN